MARVRDVMIDEVPAALRPIYERYAGDYGGFENAARVFAHRPILLERMMGMMLALKDEGFLDKRVLEIVMTAVARTKACTYCVAHHAPRLLSLGLGPESIDAILEPDCPGLDERDRLVRDYAVQVVTDPRRLSDTIFEKMRATFSEPEIVEITFRACITAFYSDFNNALDTAVEDDFLAGLKALEGAVALERQREAGD